MWWYCVQRSSVWSDDRAASRNADLDRRRSDGSAARIYGLEWNGANDTSGKSVFGPRFCFPWAPGRSDQDVVVGRGRAVSFREATRKRKIHLAASDEWGGVTHAGTTIDVARRDRLAASGAQS